MLGRCISMLYGSVCIKFWLHRERERKFQNFSPCNTMHWRIYGLVETLFFVHLKWVLCLRLSFQQRVYPSCVYTGLFCSNTFSVIHILMTSKLCAPLYNPSRYIYVKCVWMRKTENTSGNTEKHSTPMRNSWMALMMEWIFINVCFVCCVL